MTLTNAHARTVLGTDTDWEAALDRTLASLAGIQPSVVFMFASYHYTEQFPELLRETWRRIRTPVLIGCSGSGIIGNDQEVEHQPALAITALSLPGANLATARFTQEMIDASPDGADWPRRTGIAADAVNGWLVFADPLHLDGDGLLAALSSAYPNATIMGGFASPGPSDRRTTLFLDGEHFASGAVALAIGGGYELLPVVSQGCDPIGEAWTITGVQSHWIESISNRPAVQVLAETLNGLPEDLRDRAQRNLLVGLAVDEYRSEFLRGDFLVRNLIGIDQATGAIAVGATPRVGQTIQFQMRDAATADFDLNLHLEHARGQLNRRAPVAGVLCSCTGRGAELFGRPHHDAMAVGRKLGGVPLSGLFCAGEIGPIGGKSSIHGFTASLALIVPTDH